MKNLNLSGFKKYVLKNLEAGEIPLTKFGFTTEEIDWVVEQDMEFERMLEDELEKRRETQLTRKQREDIFLLDGSVTEAKARQMRTKYLFNRYTEATEKYFEARKKNNLTDELAKRVKAGWNYQFFVYKPKKNQEISDELLDQARKVPISNFIEVKRKFALCPFHNEKSPSMSVTANLFLCFGCQEGGDVIDFVMKLKNLKFKEAVNLILNL